MKLTVVLFRKAEKLHCGKSATSLFAKAKNFTSEGNFTNEWFTVINIGNRSPDYGSSNLPSGEVSAKAEVKL